MRKPVKSIWAKFYLCKQFQRKIAGMARLDLTVDQRRFRDQPMDRQARVQTGEGVLKNDLRMAPQGAQALLGKACPLMPNQFYKALSRFHQSHDRPCKRRLAATRFPHQPQRFPSANGQGYTIHSMERGLGGLKQALPDRKAYRQVFNSEHRLAHRGRH
jgi:hypothetical protein